MSRNHKLERAIRLALLSGVSTALLAAAPSAFAQPAGRPDLQPLDEIVVTGSRILRRDFEATSPVFTIDEEFLRDAGTPQIEQVLNQLPQLVPSITTTSNNPSNAGQANVNLRGLGTNRTLVLLNGTRVQPSNVGGVVDLNTIPAALIRNIEILTGGASAAYGSDAIAGVVNINLRRDFEGVQISHQSSMTEENEKSYATTLLMGGNFADGRGNAVLSFTYDKRDEILQGDRAFSRVALGGQLQPLGSGTIPDGRYDVNFNNAPTLESFQQFIDPSITAISNVSFNTDGTLFTTVPVRNYKGDTNDPGFNPDNFTYNYAPPNALQLPISRRQIAAFGHYELNPSWEVYSRMMFTTYSATQTLAATPISAGVGSTMPMSNTTIPDDLRAILLTRPDPNATFTFSKRPTEVGPRVGEDNHDVFQLLIGSRGDFDLAGRDWNWDLSGGWGQTRRVNFQSGNISRSRLQAAYNDPAVYANQGCPEFNPFGLGAISPACIAAVAIQATNVTTITSSGYLGYVSGSLFDLPAGPLQTVFGAEYRENEGSFKPDEFLASGDVVGFNAGKPVDGKIDVTEAFFEFSAPILADMPGVNYLGFDGAFRYSDYNLAGSVNTFMAGLEYRPIDEVKVRGSFNRAIRAPSITELFSPQQEGFPTFSDPCWNNSAFRTGPNAAEVNALCAAQGVPANFPQGNTQVRTLSGGNPDLAPEEADTYTFGLVWQPTFGDHSVRMALDWYQIEVEDTIGAVGATSIITRCFNADDGNPNFDPNNFWCNLWTREPSGTATGVIATDNNLGRLKTEGIDLQVDYAYPIGPGTLRATMALSHLLDWRLQEDATASFPDRTGTITAGISGINQTYPEWKGVVSTSYHWSNYDVRYTLRYIHGMDAVNDDADRSPVTAGVRPWVPTYVYHRLSGGWTPSESIRISVGIDNLFDKQPPIYTTDSTAGAQMNTEPSTYDVLGRRYFVNLDFKF